MLEALRAENSTRTAERLRYHVINRGNGRATVFHKAYISVSDLG
jgi:hypothetical protein